eukprot:2603041-Pleurochrysis_carterae.AAC.2
MRHSSPRLRVPVLVDAVRGGERPHGRDERGAAHVLAPAAQRQHKRIRVRRRLLATDDAQLRPRPRGPTSIKMPTSTAPVAAASRACPPLDLASHRLKPVPAKASTADSPRLRATAQLREFGAHSWSDLQTFALAGARVHTVGTLPADGCWSAAVAAPETSL